MANNIHWTEDQLAVVQAQMGHAKVTVVPAKPNFTNTAPNEPMARALLEAITGKKFKKGRTIKTPKEYPSESASQQAVIKWWSMAHTDYRLPENVLMAFPMQGARTAKNGARLKAEGMRAGLCDMLLAVQSFDNNRRFGALWIEQKTPTGTLQPSQKEFISMLQSQGYKAIVCRSTQEAIDAIKTYLTP